MTKLEYYLFIAALDGHRHSLGVLMCQTVEPAFATDATPFARSFDSIATTPSRNIPSLAGSSLLAC